MLAEAAKIGIISNFLLSSQREGTILKNYPHFQKGKIKKKRL
jgi:hypothetical protein